MQKYPFITPASQPHPAVLLGLSCIRTLQILDILSQIRSMCALLSSRPGTFVLMIMCCPQLHPTQTVRKVTYLGNAVSFPQDH